MKWKQLDKYVQAATTHKGVYAIYVHNRHLCTLYRFKDGQKPQYIASSKYAHILRAIARIHLEGQ